MKKTSKIFGVLFAIILALGIGMFSSSRNEFDTTVLSSEAEADCVVLIHGLGRTSDAMEKMADYLFDRGYLVINIDYPSTTNSIEDILDNSLYDVIRDNCPADSAKIHIVTHSMGGILTRLYLQENTVENLGRVVMLSPPNQGSEIADFLNNSRLVRWTMGPAITQLGTDENSVPLKLEEPDFEFGVITGDRSMNWINSMIIPGEDDGKVSVENAKSENMKDFMVVHRTHTYIMDADEVMEAVASFLDGGSFDES